MDIAPFLIDPRRLWAGDVDGDGPLWLVDLDAARVERMPLSLPPCPVVGFGDPSHPLAGSLDAVIEPPVTLAGLVGNVAAHPRAAAVLAELLRILPRLAPAEGLVAESLAYGVLQAGAEHQAWLAQPRPGAAAPGTLRLVRDDDWLTLVMEGDVVGVALRDALAEAFALAALDPSIVRIGWSAAGRSFSLGADLGEFGTTRDAGEAHAIRRRTLPARHLAQCGDRLEVFVQGACIGAGLEMAAFARRIVAAPNAWFQLPELAMGLLPGAGGCVSLTRRIGRQRTALMVFSGRRISAKAALGWGLVDEIAGDPVGADVAG
jgi:enoyl-CoA hydratase/carnithine racemase